MQSETGLRKKHKTYLKNNTKHKELEIQNTCLASTRHCVQAPAQPPTKEKRWKKSLKYQMPGI
jgi:hypothetical protein